MLPVATIEADKVVVEDAVDEQPFTRSLNDVTIPPHVRHVTIEGRDTVHGVSEHSFQLDLDLQ